MVKGKLIKTTEFVVKSKCPKCGYLMSFNTAREEGEETIPCNECATLFEVTW